MTKQVTKYFILTKTVQLNKFKQIASHVITNKSPQTLNNKPNKLSVQTKQIKKQHIYTHTIANRI